MIGAIMGAANLATGIAKGIVAKSAHNKYAKQLESMEMKMPDAVSQAEGVRTDLAYGDMPGFADMMAGVDSNTASTMTQAKQVATSPAALMDALVQSSTAGEQGKRELGVQNAQAQQTNQASLARFFESVKSPAEQRIIQFDIDKKIASNKERMQGTADLMGGVEGGIGSAFSSFGQGEQLDFMSDRNDAMKSYWGTGGGQAGQGGAMSNPNINNNLTQVPSVYGQMSGGFGGYGQGNGQGFQYPK